MRPLSLITAAAVLAAASAASSSASAQDRYSSRGVIFTPAAPSVYTAVAPQGLTARAPYAGRTLSWPGKVGGPRPQPAQAYAAPQPPRALQPARAAQPARDRYASINTAPDTAPRPYANALRQPPAPARPTYQEQPIRQAVAPAPQPMLRAPARQAPLPQSIYAEPQQAAPPPMRAPAPQAMAAAPDPDFQGPYPPATKEPWRRLLGSTAPAEGRGVAVPLPAAEAQPPAAAPAATKPAKPAKAAEAPAAPERLAAAPPGFRTPSSTSSSRFYSVHRQFGVAPDPIKMPQQFFLDGSPDLSEPPPPPVRRIAPSPGKSTAAQRAAQARSQESPDAAG